MQRDEIKREKAKKKRKSVCIDPDSVIGKEIMYQTALLHEILDEIRGGKTSPYACYRRDAHISVCDAFGNMV